MGVGRCLALALSAADYWIEWAAKTNAQVRGEDHHDPEDCDCERSRKCRGKYVVGTPGSHSTPTIYTDVDKALAAARKLLEQRPDPQPGE